MIRTDRLLELAAHLETGKLGHDKFNFGVYNANEDGTFPTSECGTMGCALGECPILWPGDWAFNTDGDPCRVPDSPRISARLWFDINADELDHLFFPRCQEPTEYGGKYLESDATKEQVAANIRAFVEKVSA